MATCKGCGAEIIWAVTVNRKRTPLDAKPEKRYVHTTRDGEEYVHLVDAYMPHHATCPEVERFRKPKADK